MNKAFSEQILADKLAKLNSTQQCIETLSHWCIFHRSKAAEVVETWNRQFNVSEMEQKVPLMYLANDILQNSKRKGNEFVTEFWKVLPAALKEIVEKGDEHGKNVVSRLVGIWEERKVFGSKAQNLKELMCGDEEPPPLELGKKRSRSVKIVKRDSKSIKTKLSVGGTVEKIVSAYNFVQSEHANEDEGMSKCKSAIRRVKKMEKDVDVALTKAKDPSRKTLAKGLEEEESLLKDCIEKLKVFEANRVALVSQLKESLREQESELENLRTQMQVAQAQAEEAANMRKQLDEDCVFEPKPSTDSNGKPLQSTKKSAAAIAAEVVDKLTASSSSQYIMTSVLSTFAAEEAKNAGLMKSSASSSSYSSSLSGPMSKSENLTPVSDPNVIMHAQHIPPHNSPYQSVMVPQPISNAPPHYHSGPNPASLQYMQQPSVGMLSSYDYVGVPPLPPPPVPPSYMVNPMVPYSQQPMNSGHQQSTFSHQQQQPQALPSFRPLAPVQAPGMVYYTHPYPSQ